MSLNLVTVTWNAQDLSAAAVGGSVSFVPTAVLTDSADNLVIGQVQKTYPFLAGTTGSASVIATDNASIAQTGWWYTITVQLNGANTYSFNAFIKFANGSTQSLASLIPILPVTPYSPYLPVSGGEITGNLTVDGWLNAQNFGLAPSGDATGVKDTAAINAAYAALGGGPGRIFLGPGQFYVLHDQLVITQPGVYLVGAGQWVTFINGVGTGTLVRMYSTQQYIPHSHDRAGGGILGVTFDLNSMGAGSVATHMGDIYNLAVDFGVRYNRAGSTKAAWFDNNYHWTEQLHGRIWCGNNAGANVVFDHSADLSGVSTGSFDRLDLDVYLDQNGLGDGVLFQNGANVINGPGLGIYGNFTGGSAQYYVLNLTGSDSSGFSLLARCGLNVGVELDTTSGTIPKTINFNSSANNTIIGCSGILDFSSAFAFGSAVNAQGSFEYDGPVYGDGFLQSSGPLGERPFKFSGSGGSGNLGNGDSITTRFSAIVEVTTSGNVTGIALQGFNPDNWRTISLMNNGTGTITMAASGTSHVINGTSCVIQPNSICQFVWNSDLSLWFPVQ